jgi:hypothetical protein
MIQIVKIKTGGRILENKIRMPRKALRFSVPAGFDEGEFGPQDLENIAPVRHRKIPGGNGEPRNWAVPGVTKRRAAYHRRLRLNGWRRNGTRFQFVTRTGGETLPDGTSMRAPYG